MALHIPITPEQLGPAVAKRLRTIPKAARKGMANGAQRAKMLLVRRTPKDRGNARAGWRVTGRGNKLAVINDVPYISVLEFGARPHYLNREGIVAVAGWFMRKFGLPEKEATSAAFGFSQNLAKHGQAPTYFVRNSMDEVMKNLGDEVDRVITKHSRTKRPR